ncbi:hypothetical protein SAMN05421771_0762 [Granulicella pectinivorans]|jgi:hypothetical protein|uniref:Uncharacterized protein n=1 Tax=Granulicella pectinivorans TaxID=474950 RepID=A0A1I6LIM8_9BACT|nr:hypothetical protein [Granulicella pectinivorans]SFS03296.1 hypothetical protein SAMN05421771_0762 [Granulicella pectinivorans]
MAEGSSKGLIRAVDVARDAGTQRAPNGVAYGIYGEPALTPGEIERLVQAIPWVVAGTLTLKEFFFVPLAMNGSRRGAEAETMIATAYTPELADDAICHRNVSLGTKDGVFLSTRLLGDKFAIAFELFINVGHAFVEVAGVPPSFAELCWTQAKDEVRGETSQDAWEGRNQALATKGSVDEKGKTMFLEAAFSDALAIYLLSLSVDFDYSELREREYPLLAPQGLAERLRHVAKLFPPNPGYEFAIKYRRRA